MKRRIILCSLLVLVTAFGIAIARIRTNKPPGVEVNRARKMLFEAEQVKSPGFAKENYQEALEYYDSAMNEWSRENKKIIFFRNYQRISTLAGNSSECSNRAIDIAKKNISKIEDKLKIRIDELGNKIRKFEEKLNNFPIDGKNRKEIVKCKLQYSEGLLAYKNKNYSLCESKLNLVEITIKRVYVPYIEKFNLYLKKYPKWKEMIKQTINDSKKNRSYAIIVDKITKKKSNGQTKYYKALLLDYPNEEDKIQFALNKKNGVINPEAKIGGLIEIHGCGGNGIDWTDGCIALRNADMDIIFKLCTVGTEVTIVGSAKSLYNISIN